LERHGSFERVVGLDLLLWWVVVDVQIVGIEEKGSPVGE